MTEKTIGNLALDDKENAGSKTPASLADLQKLPVANDPKYNVPVADFVARHAEKNAKNNTANNDIAETGKENSDKNNKPDFNPELSKKTWDDETLGKRWDSSAKYRAAERVLSRGVFGAAAFALGGQYTKRSWGMKDYRPDMKLSEIAPSRPLQYVAKSIDYLIANPIKFAGKLITGDAKRAERWVHFRPTNNLPLNVDGRSLGHEAIGLTFDFFCASVADAATRGFIDAFDPNIKHSWRDKDGHINPLQTIKQSAKAIFRYITYNGGEDWFVAIPYAYFVRSQRSVIKHFSPGFGYDSDRNLNGASFKVNNAGKVIGNYNIEGLLDLQGRFTAYNTGTLMFRELYAKVDDALHGKHTHLYGANYDANGNEIKKEKHNLGEDISNTLKWVARSTIKGVITMTPAVPFFSVFRVPQTKYRGLFIDQNEGVLGYNRQQSGDNFHNKEDMLHANELRTGGGYLKKHNPDVNFRKYTNKQWYTSPNAITSHPLSDHNKPFDAYGKTFGVFDSGLNAIGKVQNTIRSHANDFAKDKFGIPKRAMDDYVNAAFAYTPYMFAKRETALLWDNGKMDMAAERLIDGATNLNWGEVKKGAGEIWKTLRQAPLEDEAREKEAQKRIETDTSLAYGITQADPKEEHASGRNIPFFFKENKPQQQLPWKDRIIQGQAKDSKIDDLKTKPLQKRADKYADNVEMQNLLKSIQPPTNSIH